MTDAAPRSFSYHVEPAAGAFQIGIALVIAALLLPGVLRLILALTAGGPLAFAALQRLRRGRGIRLELDAFAAQGSISGRRHEVAYRAIRGLAATRRCGLGVLYYERSDPSSSSSNQPGDAPPALSELRGEYDAAFPPRPRLIVTAPVADIDALLEELRRRCPMADGVSAGRLDRLIRRRQWRDRLIAACAVLGTPLYVMVAARVIAGVF
jgi:hypothetical protein